jgi:thioredoxin reductase
MPNFKNIIIGAGPAGLQLGYFFQKYGVEYVILEKNAAAASFFDNYPLSGKLISINKPNTGSDNPEFNLRHDWNSLLNKEGHLFKNYSKDYYPDSKDLVKYLNDFAIINNLNIVYNTKVVKVMKSEDGESKYIIYTDEGFDNEIMKNIYSCEKLIIATGLSKMKMPGFESNVKRPVKHYGQYEKGYFQNPENLEKYRNKSLLLVGNGNAAFELGNLLNHLCSSILILGKKPKEWAMSTHYTGDLRSIYLPLYDTFLLKSLNGFDNQKVKNFTINQETEDSKYTLTYICNDKCKIVHNYLEENFGGVDEVIYCTGWGFDNSIFDFDIQLVSGDKYPAINSYYESLNNKDLYFIGSLMHSLDFKKSSGGFIHGFRYLIGHFFNMNFAHKFDVDRFKLTASLSELLEHIMYRINVTSSLYQMYGEMCDLFYEDPETDEIVYYNSVNLSTYINDMPKLLVGTYFFTLKLEYGQRRITNIYEFGLKASSVGTESQATLLHPVIYVYKDTESGAKILVDTIHFDEDLFADYLLPSKYSDKLYRTLRMFIDL